MQRYALILLFAFSCRVASIDRRNIRIKATPVRDIGSRIVNGDQAELGFLKWQIGIYGLNGDGYYFCGGSLISDEWVLTAAHCLEGALAANIYSNTTRISDPNSVVSQAAEFIQHEEYVASLLKNDIGLIRLKTPVKFNDYTNAIALAKKDPPVGTNVTVSGWGVTKDSDVYTSDILYYTEVQVIENSNCAAVYGSDIVGPAVMCANPGNPHTSPCQGDSGAPVAVMDSCGKPVQVGVFSFTNGYGCEYPYPSGNTRVASFRDWIKEKTGI